MKNIIKSFSLTLIFIISFSESITLEELWDYATKKIKSDDRYFIVDPENKLSESEINKIEESSKAIFMRYGVNTHLFIINEVKDKDLFIHNLILKLNDKLKKIPSNSILSIVIIKDNYYYLKIGNDIQTKLKSKEIDKIKDKSIKLGYEKYFITLIDGISKALFDYEFDEEDYIPFPIEPKKNDDIDWDDLEPKDDYEYEKLVKEEYERRKKEQEAKENIKYIKNDKGFGSYVLTFLLICTICIVGIYVVHNYRRKLLKKKISVDIDYKNITEI